MEEEFVAGIVANTDALSSVHHKSPLKTGFSWWRGESEGICTRATVV